MPGQSVPACAVVCIAWRHWFRGLRGTLGGIARRCPRRLGCGCDAQGLACRDGYERRAGEGRSILLLCRVTCILHRHPMVSRRTRRLDRGNLCFLESGSCVSSVASVLESVGRGHVMFRSTRASLGSQTSQAQGDRERDGGCSGDPGGGVGHQFHGTERGGRGFCAWCVSVSVSC